MEIVGVRVELPSNTPIVLLREAEGRHRMLPIFIGGPEATAIALALDEVATPRPMTHDLIKNMLDALETKLVRLDITSLEAGTFYADMHLQVGERVIQLTCRPSDGIALALRAGAPVFAAEDVIDEAGYTIDDEEEREEVVEQFREFIDSVNPEDFAS
jgi:bifunctional DNase/RNase